MEQALATIGVWAAVAVIGYRGGEAGVFTAFLAVIATAYIW